jgi:ribonucleoside-diphosphate reductase alpha chain
MHNPSYEDICEYVDNNIYHTKKPKIGCYVKERFNISQSTFNEIKELKPKFGYNGFGEFIFYRTYSRTRIDGSNESWADCVIRVISGVMSIRKDWYIKNCIEWNEEYWQECAHNMAISFFNLHWCPPGRGLWAMGSDYIYETGSLALFNCAATKIENIPNDIHWLMDCLMNGVGVGFEATRLNGLEVFTPKENNKWNRIKIIIGDTREEWCDSVKLLLESHLIPNQPYLEFDYNEIRPAGKPIKRFGGVSSGPDPLKKLHDEIRIFMKRFINESTFNYDSVMLKADLANCVGCCVVAGNVRRSAEIAIGDIEDSVFLDLKNYEDIKFAYRKVHGWMSNNTARLKEPVDFEMLPDIAARVKIRGEPGYFNIRNVKYGRVGKFDENIKVDDADLLNPCGEIPLCNKELCNLSETFPTQSEHIRDWYEGCKYATFYSSTVALLPTHRPESNKVIAKNRRIGIGLVDFTGWKHKYGVAKVTRFMREGYKIIKQENKRLAEEAGVPESIRVTTIKPGGTVPKLAGKTSGIGHPNFIFTKRRVRVAKYSLISKFLKEHNVKYEDDKVSMNTEVFEFPIMQGPAKPADQITLWEQAMNLVLVQREWADNAVSNTLNFKPMWKLVFVKKCEDEIEAGEVIEEKAIEYEFINYEWLLDGAENRETKNFNGQHKMIINYNIETQLTEIKVYEYDPLHEEDQIEAVLASIAPLTKSVSLLPHENKGCYEQMPEEGMTEEEYNEMLKNMKSFDWSKFKGSDGIDEKFCDGGSCEINEFKQSGEITIKV